MTAMSASMKRQIKAHATIIAESARAITEAVKTEDVGAINAALNDAARSVGTVNALVTQFELDQNRKPAIGSGLSGGITRGELLSPTPEPEL